MTKGNNIIIKLLILALFFVFSYVSAFAANISLSGIDADQNPENEYSIFIKTDKKANIKVQSSENNKLTVLLNSTLPTDSLEIVYDDAPDMTNVIVQKKNKKNTLILFEGENISKAKIYNNDLSTGLVKAVYNDGILNNLLSENKMTSAIFAAIAIIFSLVMMVKPRNKKYNIANSDNINRQRKQSKANTLRNKNLVQSRNIPSIAYNVNGSFNSAQKYMSTPADLVVNEQYEEEEEIRKAG